MALDSELLARIDERTTNIMATVNKMEDGMQLLHDRVTKTNEKIAGPEGLEHRMTTIESSIKTMKALVSTVGAVLGGIGGYIGFK